MTIHSPILARTSTIIRTRAGTDSCIIEPEIYERETEVGMGGIEVGRERGI